MAAARAETRSLRAELLGKWFHFISHQSPADLSLCVQQRDPEPDCGSKRALRFGTYLVFHSAMKHTSTDTERDFCCPLIADAWRQKKKKARLQTQKPEPNSAAEPQSGSPLPDPSDRDRAAESAPVAG